MWTKIVHIIRYSKFAAECRKEVIFIEDTEIVLERHEQRIKTLERDMSEMKGVQAEIRSMNETLVTLATELKHTNEHMARHERKIDEIDSIPKQRMQQIITAIIAALAGGLISTIIGMIVV